MFLLIRLKHVACLVHCATIFKDACIVRILPISALLFSFLLAGILFFTRAVAQGSVGLSGGVVAGIQEVVEDQRRFVIRTDSVQSRLQGDVVVETGAGKSVITGAGEAAKPLLCPPPIEPFTCGVVVPPLLPDPITDLTTEPFLEPLPEPIVVPSIEG